MGKYVSAADAVKVIKSGDRVYVQAAAATPTILTKALAERAAELRNVEVCHLHTEGEAPYANPELRDSFHVNSFFIGQIRVNFNRIQKGCRCLPSEICK